MNRRLLLVLAVVAAIAAGALWFLRRGGPPHLTGFVEGEERILRSEVGGRVLEVLFAEGDAVPAGAVVARLDDADVQAKLASKRQELAVVDADLTTQRERIDLTRSTWTRDRAAREADVRQAETTAQVADRTLAREAELAKTGASTAQLLDDARMRRDQARSTLDRAREMAARATAEERTIAIAEHELQSLQARRELLARQIAELEVTLAKYAIHAPPTGTVVQTQFLWPGELAQPGTAVLSVLDPADKYVQVYVPVTDVGRLRIGQRVSIELDEAPGHRIPGEVSFLADTTTFTPEKIETRSDRIGQVYRAKIRVLEDVARLKPGAEGNVYFDEAPAS